MDQHSASDPEVPTTYDADYWAHFLDDLDEDDTGGDGPHLISVDELWAAGALDVPPSWRKSLGVERIPERGLFSDEDLWHDDGASSSDVDSDESVDNDE